MNASAVRPSRPDFHYVDPAEPAISQARGCDERNCNCSCPDAAGPGDVNEKEYWWVAYLLTLVPAALGGIVWLLQKYFPGKFGPGGGATGSGGTGTASTGKPREEDPSSVSARTSLSELTASIEMKLEGFGFFADFDRESIVSPASTADAALIGGAARVFEARPAAAFAGR